MRGSFAIAVAAAFALLAPSLASASTVSVQQQGKVTEVFYVAEQGEANALVATTDGADLTVRDEGAVVQPGAGCAPGADEHEATCDFPGTVPLNVTLRDRADLARAVGSQIRLRASGGTGADRLVGGGSFDLLDGGRDPDVLLGRGSADAVVYDGRPDDLRVTLGDGTRNDGGPLDGGKRDRLRGFENVFAGEGDDVLVGTAAADRFVGRGGRDVLIGRGGGDELNADDQRDRARGGPGADLFRGGDGGDRLRGGPGPDTFQGGSHGDGADVFAGGRGVDHFQGYAFGALRITLDGEPNDGLCADPECNSSSSHDNLVGIEEVSGGFGDDVLIGSRRDEIFHPFPGADRVRARGGDDVISLPGDGEVDRVNCGPGFDEITGEPDVFDQNPNCET